MAVASSRDSLRDCSRCNARLIFALIALTNTVAASSIAPADAATVAALSLKPPTSVSEASLTVEERASSVVSLSPESALSLISSGLASAVGDAPSVLVRYPRSNATLALLVAHRTRLDKQLLELAQSEAQSEVAHELVDTPEIEKIKKQLADDQSKVAEIKKARDEAKARMLAQKAACERCIPAEERLQSGYGAAIDAHKLVESITAHVKSVADTLAAHTSADSAFKGTLAAYRKNVSNWACSDDEDGLGSHKAAEDLTLPDFLSMDHPGFQAVNTKGKASRVATAAWKAAKKENAFSGLCPFGAPQNGTECGTADEDAAKARAIHLDGLIPGLVANKTAACSNIRFEVSGGSGTV